MIQTKSQITAVKQMSKQISDTDVAINSPNNLRLNYRLLHSSLGVCFCLISFTPWVLPMQAQASHILTAQAEHLDRELVSDSSNQGQPDRGQVPGRPDGGGIRGDCPDVQTPLRVIIPYKTVTLQGTSTTYVGGATVSEHPTLWFYVPYTLSPDLTADFILKDDEDTNDTAPPIYKVRISSSNLSTSEQTPGLIQVSLAHAPLVANRQYRWFFKVNCDTEVPIYTEGGIKRVELDAALSSQLAAASPQDKAKIYESQGIWYDAIDILAGMHRENPTDAAVTAEWKALLKAIEIPSEGIP
jgi:Domain of Unknown Function (DUF928)